MSVIMPDGCISKDWRLIEPVEKGWSDDTKYCIETNDNRRFMLRISDISLFDKKKKEYEVMRMFDNSDILMSKPIDFGACNEGKSVFILLTWIEGEDARENLPELSAKEQYDLGYDTGKTLRKIHSIPAPLDQEDWESRFNRKIDRNIIRYKDCEIKVENVDKIIDYINANRKFLSSRDQTFQHGDFHIGNMVLTPEKKIGIIDFNRYDYGDPWEEFNRIVWCAEASRYFASGRINGYFENNVPDLFFRLMALYIGSNTLASLSWAISFGEDEVITMINQTRNVLSWYNNFKSYIPSWYIPKYSE